MTVKDKATSQELAYEKILNKIVKDRMLPGTPLRQEHIAKEFGLSATPVREAFKRLENEGWLQSYPYRGTFVREFTYEEIRDMYLLREAIEGIAVREATLHASEEDFQKISKALRNEANYILKCENDSIDFPQEFSPSFDPDVDYHRSILNAAHSKLLAEKCNLLQVQFNCIALGLNLKMDIKEMKKVYSEHTLIYQAMRKGWPDIAEEILRKHISHARDSHLKCLNN